MDTFVIAAPASYSSVRITVIERDDEEIKKMFDGMDYIAGFEVSDKGVKHYHVMTVGFMTEAVRKRKSRYSKSKPGAWTWSKPDHGTFSRGVSYIIKDGDWWATSAEWRAYAVAQPPYVRRTLAERNKAPEGPQDRKNMDWFLTERNIRRLYHEHKHNVPEHDGIHDFFEVLQWIVRNTNYKLNKSFNRSLTRELVHICEQDDDGAQCVIDLLRQKCPRYGSY